MYRGLTLKPMIRSLASEYRSCARRLHRPSRALSTRRALVIRTPSIYRSSQALVLAWKLQEPAGSARYSHTRSPEDHINMRILRSGFFFFERFWLPGPRQQEFQKIMVSGILLFMCSFGPWAKQGGRGSREGQSKSRQGPNNPCLDPKGCERKAQHHSKTSREVIVRPGPSSPPRPGPPKYPKPKPQSMRAIILGASEVQRHFGISLAAGISWALPPNTCLGGTEGPASNSEFKACLAMSVLIYGRRQLVNTITDPAASRKSFLRVDYLRHQRPHQPEGTY